MVSTRTIDSRSWHHQGDRLANTISFRLLVGSRGAYGCDWGGYLCSSVIRMEKIVSYGSLRLESVPRGGTGKTGTDDGQTLSPRACFATTERRETSNKKKLLLNKHPKNPHKKRESNDFCFFLFGSISREKKRQRERQRKREQQEGGGEEEESSASSIS